MSLALRSVAAPPSVDTFAPGIQAALALLTEAHSCAQELHRDTWDFAVELHSLRGAGLSDSSLRWLLCKSYVEHAVETTGPRAPRRTFRRAGSLMFCDRSCFVLTKSGAALAGQPASMTPARGARVHTSANS